MPSFGPVCPPGGLSPLAMQKCALVKNRQTKSNSKRGSSLPPMQNEIAGLVESYAERLVRYAFRQLGNLQDAEDVVQEVFARTFSKPARYAGISEIGPYLYRSVANASTDLLRKRNRAAVYREEVDSEKILSQTDGPAEVAQSVEGSRRAEAWLKLLPGEQSEAIRLRVFDGLSLNEIAAVLDCPMNTVCSRLRYGFQKLRGLIAVKKE
jgi:RNA polymerase sigma-70 factor, ECF subfamily